MVDRDNNPWFGPKPWGQLCLEAPKVDAPVGEPCLHCEEAIDADAEGMIMPPAMRPIHRECLLRTVLGSVGHQKKTCHCHGGTEEDPPGLSKRDAARAAVAYWKAHGHAGDRVFYAISPLPPEGGPPQPPIRVGTIETRRPSSH